MKSKLMHCVEHLVRTRVSKSSLSKAEREYEEQHNNRVITYVDFTKFNFHDKRYLTKSAIAHILKLT